MDLAMYSLSQNDWPKVKRAFHCDVISKNCMDYFSTLFRHDN